MVLHRGAGRPDRQRDAALVGAVHAPQDGDPVGLVHGAYERREGHGSRLVGRLGDEHVAVLHEQVSVGAGEDLGFKMHLFRHRR